VNSEKTIARVDMSGRSLIGSRPKVQSQRLVKLLVIWLGHGTPGIARAVQLSSLIIMEHAQIISDALSNKFTRATILK